MKPHFAIPALTLLLSLALPAQDAFNSLAAEDLSEEPLSAAIREFNKRSQEQAGETVDVSEHSIPDDSPLAPEAPVLVTGKRPSGTQVIDISDIPTIPEGEMDPLLMEESTKEPGLEMRVEKLQQGRGDLDPEKVLLRAPFPPKPLDDAPEGWRLERSEDAPPFTREVELAPGKTVTLSIRPHLLVPEADGVRYFAVQEPGFKASLGYQQSDTVASVLSESIHQLDQDSRQIGQAIDRLQQLIVSLPKPDPASNSNPSSK